MSGARLDLGGGRKARRRLVTPPRRRRSPSVRSARPDPDACDEPCAACGDECVHPTGHENECQCTAHRKPVEIVRGARGVRNFDKAVDPSTTKQYRKAFNICVDWLKGAATGKAMTPLSLDDLVLDPPTLDDSAAAYIQVLWETKQPKGAADGPLSGLLDAHPRLKGELRTTWRRYGAWTFEEPSQQRAAWPALLALAMARAATLADRWDVAVGLLVGFHCLLRPAELANLTKGDFTGSSDLIGLAAPMGLFAIHNPKTKRKTAASQHVIVENETLLQELELYIDSLGGDATHLFLS